MNRYTFVVHAYPGCASMLENLSTHERIRVPDLAAVGPQIESWLAGLAQPAEPLDLAQPAEPVDPAAGSAKA